jgi:hypothetical protein
LPAIDRQTHQFLLPTPSKSVKDAGVAATLAAPDPFDSLNVDVRTNAQIFCVLFDVLLILSFVLPVGRSFASIVGWRTQRAGGEQGRVDCSVLNIETKN